MELILEGLSMILDIEFRDFFNKNQLAQCTMKLADFSLHVQNIFLLKLKKSGGKFNDFKKHVKYTLHYLLADNYHRLKNQQGYKLDIVDVKEVIVVECHLAARDQGVVGKDHGQDHSGQHHEEDEHDSPL